MEDAWKNFKPNQYSKFERDINGRFEDGPDLNKESILASLNLLREHFKIRLLQVFEGVEVHDNGSKKISINLETVEKDPVAAIALLMSCYNKKLVDHQNRVGELVEDIAREMGLDEETVRLAHDAGVLHDLGKIFMQEEIIFKDGRLTDEEFNRVKQHPYIAFHKLKDILDPKLRRVIHQHHENFDGNGYPSGLAETNIELAARIIRLADTFDAMVNRKNNRGREQSGRKSVADALSEIQSLSGKHYDPDVVTAFLRLKNLDRYVMKEAE